jgi:hypothetical protein
MDENSPEQDDADRAAADEQEPTFSRRSEARLCEQVLGDRRHGL